MLRINQLKLSCKHTSVELEQKICQILKIKQEEIIAYQIIKKSIDARKKPDVFFVYVVDVEIKSEQKIKNNLAKYKEQVQLANPIQYQFSAVGTKELSHEPVIVGAGPAGLFCAYFLAREGYCPILLERGKTVNERQQDVELFWNTGILNTESNVQFGEGGAGTFSDGKLNTLNKDKDGKNKEVLSIFVECGAPSEILYDTKPHIGTDVLCKVVETMRKKIIAWGGQVLFQQKVTGVLIDDTNTNPCVKGLIINDTITMETKHVVLAIGHSARDTFQMLFDKGVDMEAKSFAVGFRVEHLQSMMNETQYGTCNLKYLPQATYKVVQTVSEKRSVYSFCMCPGGYVVNASSEIGRLVVNGMSYLDRGSNNANSAIIVSVSPNDFGSNHPLAGVEFQRKLEEKAYQLAGGKIPLQRYGTFKSKECKSDFTKSPLQPCTKGAFEWADLSSLLPLECKEAFIVAMESFGKKMKGFNQEDTILSGVESRTSSPIRIKRNEGFQANIKGLYPCGEGAGYAGGIMSAAMDGMKIAEVIGFNYKPLTDK